MERQLVLLDTEPDWRLDEHTREVGRAGLAEARAALQAALRKTEAAGSGTASRTAA